MEQKQDKKHENDPLETTQCRIFFLVEYQSDGGKEAGHASHCKPGWGTCVVYFDQHLGAAHAKRWLK